MNATAAQTPGRIAAPILSRKLSEDQIHRALIAHLKARARPGVVWFHPANGGGRQRVEAARFVGLGVQAGVPDIVIVQGGRALFLEIKTETGRTSPVQQTMHAALRAAGAEVVVARGFVEALRQLETWGLFR